MITSYVLYDEENRRIETYAGPHRLARFDELPVGWSIEEFLGDVSRGIVDLASVKHHASEKSRQCVKLPDTN